MKEDKEQPKKTIQLTPAQRKAVILKIAEAAKNNPEFKMKVDKMMVEAKIKLIASEFLEDKRLQLFESEFKELESVLNNGQIIWEELPSELKCAYSRYGSEERSAEWERLSKIPGTGIGKYE